MDKKTLTALTASIKHWESNARRNPENARLGYRNCPLCAAFCTPRMNSENRCRKCPVAQQTGLKDCVGTPYANALMSRYQGKAVWRRAARKELAFLKSLLPVKP